jgi:hypothetical protein
MASIVTARMGMEDWWKETDRSTTKYSGKSITQQVIWRRSERATPIFCIYFSLFSSSILCFPDSLILFLSFFQFSTTFTTLQDAEKVKSLKWHSQNFVRNKREIRVRMLSRSGRREKKDSLRGPLKKSSKYASLLKKEGKRYLDPSQTLG